ncbi:MAG TPA: hypothetical protein VIE42_00440 [Steroidobacteraceae bacterium]|jgi:broad specificity phosphatase PhoE
MDALTKVMVIRHAEKPPGNGKPHGVDADGARDDSSLTVRGWQRAGALAGLFAPSNSIFVSALLAKPSTIFAANPSGGSNRPLQTIKPLLKKSGAELVDTFTKGQEAELAAEILRRRGVVLVSWQHERICEIATQLTASNPPEPRFPAAWPDERFDVVWVFSSPAKSGQRWSFAQVPQLLLSGDSSTPLR